MSYKYLDFIREQNKARVSKCHICKKQSTEINAYKHEIKYVCEDHFEAGIRVILDTSMLNIIHYTYPDGKDVPEHMMDPNIGGFRGTSKKDDQE